MNNHLPLVSVIIPCYNEEKYIFSSVNSILAQDHSNIEIIIIDDSSTDNTVGMINTLRSQNEEKIKLIAKQHNKGVVDSLNIGIEQAKGKYIARMDADDVSLPSRISKQVDLMESNDRLVVCGTGHYFLNFRDSDYREIIPSGNDRDIKRQMSMYSPINAGTAMYRAEAIKRIGGFSANDVKAEGFSMLIRLNSLGQFGNVSEPLYVYFLRGSRSNRSASDGFSGRNAAMVDMVSRASSGSKLKVWTFMVIWSVYRYIPRSLVAFLRPFVSKKSHRKLSTVEIDFLSDLSAR